MKYLKTTFFSIILIIGLISCSSSDEEILVIDSLDTQVKYEELNVSYGDDEDQKFDIYLPANRNIETTKTIILIHGGGWSSGDKEDMVSFVGLIQQDFTNVAVVNINYRLADDNNPAFPMQLDDITTIVNQLKENRNFYSISEQIGFIGISAGAHLSMLWSYDYDVFGITNMVCSIVGPTNFTDPAYLKDENNPVLQEFLSVFPSQTTEFLESVSPLHQVKVVSPPTILFYGGQDPLVPTSQAFDMRDKLEELNIVNQLTLYQEEGHGWIGLNALDTWLKLSAFINTNL
jgi:acetyl esterase/lipase